jgi:hypothetical protein
MMALSFPEKQKWVATLEALVSEQHYDSDSYVVSIVCSPTVY